MKKEKSEPNQENKEEPSALSINRKAALRILRHRRQLPSTEQLLQGIISGDRVLLSRAITLIESENPDHFDLAKNLVEACLLNTKPSVRIGITGSPGVGKSTFIETLGTTLIATGAKVAVLAIDPSSQLSRGSILGDKTRMERLSTNPQAYIRPSPAGSSLGGVTRKTRETIILCEAAGFDTIIVETVGVGQSETAVHSMVDCFLLLLLPGAGDELQGIKRGIVEMADIVAVNKSDGERVTLAKQTRQAYRNALHLFPPKESAWTPKVATCSALEEEGIDKIKQLIKEYQDFTTDNGYFQHKRQNQAKAWLQESISQQLQQLFYQNPQIQARLEMIEAEVLAGRRSPFRAAKELLDLFGKGDQETTN